MAKKYLTDDIMHGLTTASKTLGRNSSVSVVFEGGQARTDGDTIYLPALPSGQYLDSDSVRTIRGFADHEAGHIRHTDMKSFQRWAKKNHKNELLMSLNNCLEDVRIEGEVMKDYSGSQVNLNTLQNKNHQRAVDSVADQGPDYMIDDPKQVGPSTIVATGCAARGGVDAASKFLEHIGPNTKAHAENWVEALGRCRTSRDVQRLAEHIYKLIEEDPELEEEPEEIPDEAMQGDDGDDEHEPEGQEKQEADAAGEEGDGGGMEGEGEGEEKFGGYGECESAEFVKNLSDEVGQVVEEWKDDGKFEAITPLTTKYDRWHTPDTPNDTVRDVYERAQKVGMKEYQESLRASSSTVNILRSKVMRYLKAKEMRDWEGGREIGRLDTRRLVSAYNGAPNVFKVKTERDEINTAISILLDCSGSMQGRRAYATRDCAIAIAEALESTQFKYTINGFSEGYDGRAYAQTDRPNTRIGSLDLFSFKAWDQRLFEAKPYLGAIPYFVGSGNNDPEAILWAAEDLNKRQELKKVMLVLSDGVPAYSIRNTTFSNAARKVTKNAVKKCTQSGIQMIGIGIQFDAARSFYPRCHVVNQVSDLGSTVMDEILKLV